MKKGFGLRNIKTAVAVTICVFIYILLIFIMRIFNSTWDDSIKYATMSYTPFFAALASAYSMATDRGKTLLQMKTRIVASIIGGLVGVAAVFIYSELLNLDWPFQFINSAGKTSKEFTINDVLAFIAPIILTGFSTVITIWLCNVFKQKGATFPAVLTLTAVMTSLGTNAILYGFNRIWSTIVGVVIAYLVNSMHLPHKARNTDLLFCIGIEGMLSHDNDQIVGYANYKMNSLNYNGCNCTVFTTRIPTTFMHLFGNVKIDHPVVCMSGAALYDPKGHKYLATEEIPYDVSVRLDNYLDSLDVTPFKNYIVNDVLNISIKKIDNIGERMYFEGKKNGPYCYTTVVKEFPKTNVLYYLIVERASKVNDIVQKIHEEFEDELFAQIYDYFGKDDSIAPELKYIKIYSKKVLELNVLKNYAKNNNMRIVGLTNSELSNHLLNNSDLLVTSTNIDKEHIHINSNYEEMFRQIPKLYYGKKYQRR